MAFREMRRICYFGQGMYYDGATQMCQRRENGLIWIGMEITRLRLQYGSLTTNCNEFLLYIGNHVKLGVHIN